MGAHPWDLLRSRRAHVGEVVLVLGAHSWDLLRGRWAHVGEVVLVHACRHFLVPAQPRARTHWTNFWLPMPGGLCAKPMANTHRTSSPTMHCTPPSRCT